MAGMAHMQVVPVIEELLVLTGETQAQFARRLHVSQTTISRWLNGETEPAKSQWDIIADLYFQLKGWQSIDDRLKPFDSDFQASVRRVVDEMIQIQDTRRRR